MPDETYCLLAFFIVRTKQEHFRARSCQRGKLAASSQIWDIDHAYAVGDRRETARLGWFVEA